MFFSSTYFEQDGVEWLFWPKIWFASARVLCCASRQIFGRMVFERLSWANNYFFLLLLNTLLCFQTLVRLVLSVCFGPQAVCFCSRTLLCLLSPESRHLTSVVEYMPYTSAVCSWVVPPILIFFLSSRVFDKFLQLWTKFCPVVFFVWVYKSQPSAKWMVKENRKKGDTRVCQIFLFTVSVTDNRGNQAHSAFSILHL